MSDESESKLETAELDFWRLCDELTVHQAALLTVGENPGQLSDAERLSYENRPTGYEAAKSGIQNALRSGKIIGTVEPKLEPGLNGLESVLGTVDVHESRVEVESLKAWLASRGFRKGFFFPEQTETPDYLDPNNGRYAPKLAAAVRAWLDVSEVAGRTPKQMIEKWLREHAAQFDLVDDKGKPNETGILEIAKVANWQPGGGAPKTPGSN